MSTPPLYMQSAKQLAQGIRQRDYTVRAVVEAHINVARAVNPLINAIVVDCYDAALAQADACDRHLEGVNPADLPPFFGVPFTIKEAFATQGMPHSSGLWSRRDLIAEADCPTVARLRGSGAIPIGVTNISELCMWYESSNRVYGRCGNAYDHRKIAGGSSGGEGAIVGSGASPFGLGADIGGSIRMPAFFNGVYGHKPSAKIVPSTGLFPISENDALKMLGTGPLSRRAEDLWPLLQLLVGPDGQEAGVKMPQLQRLPPGFLKGRKVISVHGNGLLSVQGSLLKAQSQVEDYLKDAGAQVERRDFPLMKKSVDMWSACLDAAEGTAFRDLVANGQAFSPLFELAKWCFGASKHTLPALLLALVEKVPKLLPVLNRRALTAKAQLQIQLDEALGDGGVLLFPSHPRVAPGHHWPLLMPLNFAYTALINVLEYPATQIPLGLDGAGLPLGLQIIAPHGWDNLTIQIAEAVEKDLGGWQLPEQSARLLRPQIPPPPS